MKKDRNCGTTPYPVYPPYQGMGMGMVPPYGMPNSMQPMMPMGVMGGYPGAYQNTGGITSNTIEQQMNTMQQQINSLESRVSTLENMANSSNSVLYSNNKYNSSNYQMM